MKKNDLINSFETFINAQEEKAQTAIKRADMIQFERNYWRNVARQICSEEEMVKLYENLNKLTKEKIN